MKICDVYTNYQIPKNLQEHMYRVAAVGLVLKNFIQNSVDLNVYIVVTDLLLHDIGNIIKFDFEKITVPLEEDIEYLKKIKQDFISRYGNEEHAATLSIAKELKVSEKIIEILQNSGSSNVHKTIESKNWYLKVCSYADFRVAPYGVTNLNQRFDDVLKRYEGREHVLADIEKTEQKRKNALLLEEQIQEKSPQSLFLINDEMIEPIIETLREYNIS